MIVKSLGYKHLKSDEPHFKFEQNERGLVFGSPNLSDEFDSITDYSFQ